VRRPHRAKPGTWSADLQMAPLIDAVFLLLTYFLFTISLSTIEGLLPSELALGDDFREERVDLETPKRQVIVRLVQAGERVQYFIDDWPANDFDAVRSHLSGLSEQDVLVIDAGATVAYEHVVHLYNYCLKSDIRNVVFPLTASSGSAPRL
jgi:biopolymer transport protein ExbD